MRLSHLPLIVDRGIRRQNSIAQIVYDTRSYAAWALEVLQVPDGADFPKAPSFHTSPLNRTFLLSGLGALLYRLNRYRQVMF